MSIPAQHGARISHHVYNNEGDPVPFEVGATLEIDDRKYRILYISDGPNQAGYQGAIYQDQITGELAVAHRGTETSMEGLALAKDGAVDLQMVMARANAQTPFAEALTQKAMEMAKNPKIWPFGVTSEPPVSHLGHSLGGYHGQDRADAHQQGGQSYSAFGAAGIGQAPAGIVEGRPAFISHIRATDVVANASRHYGDVVHYATTEDLAMVRAAVARPGTEGPLGMFTHALTDAGGRHAISAYGEGSVMTPENRNRYLDHQPLFEEHVRAVHESREWMTHAGDRVRWEAQNLAASSADVIDAAKRGLSVAAPLGPATLLTTVPDLSPQIPRSPEPVAPATPGPFHRIEAEARAYGGRAVASELDEAGRSIAGDLRRDGASFNSDVRDVGATVGRVVRGGTGAAADMTDATAEALAAAQRRVGEAVQSAHHSAANIAERLGFDDAAESLRGRGLDARTDAENRARHAESIGNAGEALLRTGGTVAAVGSEAGTRVVGGVVDASARGYADRIETTTLGASAGIQLGANTVQEGRYGDTAPNLDMRATARDKIEALYAEHGRPPLTEDQLDRVGAAVVADARGQGMNRIDTVMFSQGRGNGPNYEGNLIAFDRDPMNEFSRHSATSISKAQETPVEQSVERTRAANERQEQLQFELQQMQARDQAMQESQGMSMRIGARTMDGPGGEGAAAGGDGGG